MEKDYKKFRQDWIDKDDKYLKMIRPIIFENFIALCKIMKALKEPTSVCTPFGRVIFEKTPMFSNKKGD